MTEEDKSNITDNQNPEEKEIDLLEIVYKLWSRKKLILVWCMWGVIAGLVIAFSIPKEYSTSVKLAPESKGSAPVSGGLGALASMAGLSGGGNNGTDAVYPSLYPDIVGSVPFSTSLFEVPVTDKEGNVYTVRDYLLEETKAPWWGAITSLPGKVIGLMRGTPNTLEEVDHTTNNFKLTPEEDRLVRALRQRVGASVDQKTNVITISARMQDPMVSAILVDTVVVRLRQYVTDYRTNKARQDLDYELTLNEEAQQEYYKAQQKLADYIDRNQNLATRSAQVTRDRLENEASLAFNLYNETSMRVQAARSRVQETTPVYTEITPATVSMVPVSPRKGLIIGGFTFLAFAVCCAWILFGSPMVDQYKSKVKELQDNTNDLSSQSGHDVNSEQHPDHGFES